MKSAVKMQRGEWWDTNGCQIQERQEVAMCVLSAPVAEGAGKRNWSTYGLVISDLRTSLTSERAKKLVFIHMNSRPIANVRRVGYVSDAFKWDAASLSWAAEAFQWKEQRQAVHETPCDEAGASEQLGRQK